MKMYKSKKKSSEALEDFIKEVYKRVDEVNELLINGVPEEYEMNSVNFELRLTSEKGNNKDLRIRNIKYPKTNYEGTLIKRKVQGICKIPCSSLVNANDFNEGDKRIIFKEDLFRERFREVLNNFSWIKIYEDIWSIEIGYEYLKASNEDTKTFTTVPNALSDFIEVEILTNS